MTFGDACWEATNNSYLDITVQGKSVFQANVSFSSNEDVVHLRGGTFKEGIDTSNGAKPLALLDDGFAFQSDRGIVDASIPENLNGKIWVVAHTCKYVNGKCECGRSCDHVGKVNADGYCTLCKSLVEPYAIGQTRYKSLEAALDAANAGDTITLRGDFYQGSKTVEINKPVTLDLGGHTLTSDADGAPVLRVLAGNVTIQNGTVENTRTAKSSPAVTVGKLDAIGGLTVKSVTFIGSSDGNAPQEDALDIQNGHAKVESGIFNGGIFAQGSLTMTGGSTTSLELGYSYGTIQLSGGSFDCICFSRSSGGDYKALLDDGYAYQSGTGMVKLADMDSNTAVQVVKCTHPDGLTADTACPYCGKKCGHGNIDQTTGLCPDCGYQKAASLTVDGTTTFFNPVRDAAIEANGKTGALLTLLKDEVMQDTSSLTFGGGKITIDWNGHTLSGQPTNWNTVIALYGAELTLRDSSGNNAGVIYNQNADAIWVCGDGSLTIESGTYASRVFIPVGTATVKISGGIFKNDPLSTYDYAIDTGDSRCLAELMAPGYTLALDPAGRSLYDVYANKKTPEHTTVYVVPHASHTFDKNGKCTVCGYVCPHEEVTEKGGVYTCDICKQTMTVMVETADGNVSYTTDLGTALSNAEDGTTVTLLCDLVLTKGANIVGGNKTVTLNMNGHNITPATWQTIQVKGSTDDGTKAKLVITGSGEIRFHVKAEGGGQLDMSGWTGTAACVDLEDTCDFVGPIGDGHLDELNISNWRSDNQGTILLQGGSIGKLWLNSFESFQITLGSLLKPGCAAKSGSEFLPYDHAISNQDKIHDLTIVPCPHTGLDSSGRCTYCNTTCFVATVTKDGVTTGYTDFQSALDEICDGKRGTL